MIRNNALFTMMVAATLFATSAFSGPWLSSLSTVHAQASNNSSQAMAVYQLASNLTQAREAIASGNTTATAAQLTAIIGQLSDILGTVASDPNGEASDEHTHFFVHKGHTHTVTHTHPHHPSHHHDWFHRSHNYLSTLQDDFD